MDTHASAAAEAAARPRPNGAAGTAARPGVLPPLDGDAPIPTPFASSSGIPDEAALPPPAGLKDAVSMLWEDAKGALAERAKLLSLEVRLATMTLLQVIVLSVVVAVLAVTAWLALVGGLLAGLVSAGMHWAFAVALVIAINLGVAFFLVKTMVRLVERVSLPQSLRRFNSHQQPDAG